MVKYIGAELSMFKMGYLEQQFNKNTFQSGIFLLHQKKKFK